MQYQQVTDSICDHATLYALGVLSPEEAQAFASHLAVGCHVCQREVTTTTAVVGLLGHAARPVQPRPQVRERLLARIKGLSPVPSASSAALHAMPGQPVASPGTVTHTTESQWEDTDSAGLRTKQLWHDSRTQRSIVLAQMARAMQYPPHYHVDTEELYMLSGDLTVEGHLLHAGDFCAAPAGTTHGTTASTQGCTFLLLASDNNAIVASAPPAQTGFVFAYATTASWQQSAAAGVELQPLFSDATRGTMTAVVRLRPGATWPLPQGESGRQLYVLEGDGHVHGQRVQAGDYYQASTSGESQVLATHTGCRVLLLASPPPVLA